MEDSPSIVSPVHLPMAYVYSSEQPAQARKGGVEVQGREPAYSLDSVRAHLTTYWASRYQRSRVLRCHTRKPH